MSISCYFRLLSYYLPNKGTSALACLYALLPILLSLAGCGDSKSGRWVGDYVTRTDFEALRGWGAPAGALTRDHAHSGQYAAFVSPDREYSLTFDLPLHEASVHHIRGLEVEAWVYMGKLPGAATLEVQVRPPGDEDQPLLYSDRLVLTEQVPDAARWTQVRKTFTLPAQLPGEAHLRVFLWRNGSPEPAYLDDLQIKALE